jgi:hypothetical protein
MLLNYTAERRKLVASKAPRLRAAYSVREPSYSTNAAFVGVVLAVVDEDDAQNIAHRRVFQHSFELRLGHNSGHYFI